MLIDAKGAHGFETQRIMVKTTLDFAKSKGTSRRSGELLRAVIVIRLSSSNAICTGTIAATDAITRESLRNEAGWGGRG